VPSADAFSRKPFDGLAIERRSRPLGNYVVPNRDIHAAEHGSGGEMISGQLWVITAYFNWCGYKTKKANYELFARNLQSAGGLPGNLYQRES
jgi:hypothetical protein